MPIGRRCDDGLRAGITIDAHHLKLELNVPEAEIAKRRDFRGLDIVTIDGETARDFDDAVFVEKLANGNFALQVHIADVSYYVKPGSAIDREAACLKGFGYCDRSRLTAAESRAIPDKSSVPQ